MRAANGYRTCRAGLSDKCQGQVVWSKIRKYRGIVMCPDCVETLRELERQDIEKLNRS